MLLILSTESHNKGGKPKKVRDIEIQRGGLVEVGISAVLITELARTWYTFSSLKQNFLKETFEQLKRGTMELLKCI